MLDPVLFRNKLTETAELLRAKRGFVIDVAAFDALESERKQIQTRTQELQNLRNTRSKAIGIAKGKGEDTAALMAEVASIGDELKASELRLIELQATIEALSLNIPNIPHESVPVADGEHGNAEQHRWGTPRAFTFQVKDHV